MSADSFGAGDAFDEAFWAKRSVSSIAAYLAADSGVEARARAGLTAFVTVLTDDPRYGRIQLVDSVGRGGALEARRSAVMRMYADLLETQAREAFASRAPKDIDLVMGTRALVGATNQLVMDFANGDLDVDREQLIDHLVRLYIAVTFPPRS